MCNDDEGRWNRRPRVTPPPPPSNCHVSRAPELGTAGSGPICACGGGLQGVPAPCGPIFVDTFVTCSTGRRAVTVSALLPSWITRTSYFKVNKTRVHEVISHPVQLLYLSVTCYCTCPAAQLDNINSTSMPTKPRSMR